jgi:hypothetical protein
MIRANQREHARIQVVQYKTSKSITNRRKFKRRRILRDPTIL